MKSGLTYENFKKQFQEEAERSFRPDPPLIVSPEVYRLFKAMFGPKEEPWVLTIESSD